jgi:chorismate dehydratase
MARLRISAISYLNTAPLMWNFEYGTAGRDFDISYTIPSACAAALKAGTADIGIIPAAAYATVPELLILPGVAIAARSAVQSILLISRREITRAQSVALDTSSMTSFALTKVLFAKWFKTDPHFAAMGPDLEKMLQQHDAALLIGDPALQVDKSRFYTYDLAEEWIRLTGKPFVFAFWAIRSAAVGGAPNLDLPYIFQSSRDAGLRPENINQIARLWAPRLELSKQQVTSYLTSHIYYFLDPDCLDGMQLFYKYAQECGALPPAPGLRFLEVRKPVTT